MHGQEIVTHPDVRGSVVDVWMTAIDETRRRRVVLIAAASLAVVACGGSPPGQEALLTGGIVRQDVMMAGQTVRIEAEVDGDVAAAGADVTISAPVQGYIMSAGRTVAIRGPVANDIWAAGERVTIDSRIGDNAMVAGQTVRLGRGTTVGRDARLAGAEVRSEGRIANDLRIGAGTAAIGGEIGGAVHATAERVTVLPDAVVRGNLVVRSPEPPVISPQAQVMGAIDYRATEQDAGWIAWPFMWMWLFLSILVLSLAALALAPAWSERVVAELRSRTLASMLAGLLVLIVLPIVIGVLLVTVIGIPLAIVLTAVYVAALVLSAAIVSSVVGRWLLERANRAGASRWAAMALGALVVSLGLSLPFVGWAVALAVVLTGAGALAMEWRDRRTRLRAA